MARERGREYADGMAEEGPSLESMLRANEAIS
jgi:hypothetical protein